jgi:hypothetical protein
MRHRDPHDDPPAKRRPDAYRGPPVTLGDMRSHGVLRVLIYCSEGLYYHHSGTVAPIAAAIEWCPIDAQGQERSSPAAYSITPSAMASSGAVRPSTMTV